jgi:hypothetical protein
LTRRYYAEKVRQKTYSLDESEVKPYFPLDRMCEAIFDCAYQLFGLKFKLREDIASYHPDVQTYEVVLSPDMLAFWTSMRFDIPSLSGLVRWNVTLLWMLCGNTLTLNIAFACPLKRSSVKPAADRHSLSCLSQTLCFAHQLPSS